MPLASPPDRPMDHHMLDIGNDQIGPLWIRRQLFEHSVAVPLLTSSTASQIDFPRLAAELVAANVITDRRAPPAVTYDAWVAAAGLHARLDSSDHAGIIIEALETNAPDAFVACNDPEKLAPGRQLSYRRLLIPVPELLAFIKLHAAAIASSRFRESQADVVWPDPDTSSPSITHTPNSPIATAFSLPSGSPRLSSSPQSSSSSPIPHAFTASPSLSPASPRVTQQTHPNLHVQSPSHQQQAPAPPNSPGLDGFIRKKTPTTLGAAIHSQSAILASVQHAFQRETRLVVANLKSLLTAIALAYGVGPEISTQTDTISSESGIVMGGGAVAVESGTLSRDNNSKLRRAHSHGSGSEALMGEEGTKAATKAIPMSRQMFEHLSFLLTTTCDPSGQYRPVSWIVPQWRDGSNQDAISLGDLVETLTNSLTRVPFQREPEGSTDVAEIRDLDRKTILRSSIPTTNADVSGYPHAKEIRISNCSESNFYLLCSLGRVSLIACRDCTLFVGACVSVSLINCVNVRVHAIARVCRVTNSFDTHLYICTNRFPQIVGENRGLVFAPYNASYSEEEAEKYLASVGIDPSSNVWDKFYRPMFHPGSNMDKTDPDLTSAVACVLPPDLFLPFAVPVRPSVTSARPMSAEDADQMQTEGGDDERDSSSKALFTVAVPLPPAYEEQLVNKNAELNRIRKEIRACDKLVLLTSTAQATTQKENDGIPLKKDVAMSDTASGGSSDRQGSDETGGSVPCKRGIVQSLVQERFREWLNHSGRIKQINELVRLESSQES